MSNNFHYASVFSKTTNQHLFILRSIFIGFVTQTSDDYIERFNQSNFGLMKLFKTDINLAIIKILTKKLAEVVLEIDLKNAVEIVFKI